MSEPTAADPVSPCFEWFAFDGVLPVEDASAGPIAARPGAVARDERGRALALHFAPARWLLPAPDSRWLFSLNAAAAAGRGALTDVTGRWRSIDIAGVIGRAETGLRPLNAALPLESILRDRDAAATWAFDCPILIARRAATEYEVWVEASYVTSFREMLSKIDGRSNG